MLSVGQSFPAFSLESHDGGIVSSESLRGSPYLVFFYPKADTPHCSREVCSFRNQWDAVKQAGLAVFGISYDPPDRNRGFAEKFRLPFLLLSDRDHKLAKAAGAAMFLLPIPKRVSYLVGKDGRILKAYPKVDPDRHADDVLADLSNLVS